MLITSREAVRRLGVKRDTLYAYVSRGLVRSTTSPGSKEHRYYAADIERLNRSKRKGRRTGSPAAAFDLYAPVLDSGLCLLEEGRLYYRGQDAARLSESVTLEQVAALMWGSDSSAPSPPAFQLPSSFRTWLREIPQHAAPIERAKTILLRLASEDVAAIDTSLPVVRRVGRSLLSALAAAISGRLVMKSPIHEQLAKAWRLDATGADLVRRCLVLVADHELNTSTFVARCVASTRASPYDVVLAGLCALSGPTHGGQTSKAEAMLANFKTTTNLNVHIIERLRLGDPLPGFGHPLYPQGDPRCIAILDAIRRSLPKHRTRVVLDVASQVQSLTGRAPHIEFALAATSVLLDLPRGSGQGMFLVGRSVGWIAHAIEQYAAGDRIRPRARYIGVLPGESEEAARR